MVSNLLNIVLQLLEASICFVFYEDIIHIANNKYKRAIIICISYLIMCGINLLFDYNVIINIVVLLIFQFVFGCYLYKLNWNNSMFYSILITCVVIITELVGTNSISLLTGSSLKEFLQDTIQYILIIAISKSLMLIVLKIISRIINKYKYSKNNDLMFFLYPISLLVILVVFAIIYYQYDLSNSIKYLIVCSSGILILSIIVI